MSFLFQHNNNIYVLDGISRNTVWLERIIFEDDEIIYTEDYLGFPLNKFLKDLSQELLAFWEKEKEKNLGRFP